MTLQMQQKKLQNKQFSRILNRIKRILENNYDNILSVIYSDNSKNNDYLTLSIVSLFIVSYDIIKNAIFHRNKNDYYAANILIRKVYENPFVLYRIHTKKKILDFFQQKISKKDYNNLVNVECAIKRFCKDFNVPDCDKKSIFDNYNLLCRYTHYNLLQPGQYKQHMKNFNVHLRKLKTYDLKSDKDTVTFITLSTQNLFSVIEKMNETKTKYNKQIFDGIFDMIEKSKKEIQAIKLSP